MQLFERFKRPEYTGENRCFVCSIANLVLLVGICVAVWVFSRVTAVLLAAVGLVALWLRGYLVPFTPYFGPHLKGATDRLLGRSDWSAPDGGSLTVDSVSGETVVTEFLEKGVLRSEGSELRLAPAFQSEWKRTIGTVRELPLDEFAEWTETRLDTKRITDVEAVDPRWTTAYVVVSLRTGEEAVLPYPVAVAELSALVTLSDSGISEEVSLNGAGALREFLDECPVCDSPLEWSQYSGCCGNPRADGETPGLVCPQCRAVLYKGPE